MWRPDTPFAPREWRFFYGWAIVLGATIGTVFSIPGQTMGFSVFTEILMEELGLSRVQLSSAYFVGTVASGLTLPLCGRLLDRWGARKMVVASAVVTGLILFYLSRVAWLSQTIGAWLPAAAGWIVSFVAITIGFYVVRLSAQGVLTMSSRNAISKWFDYKRGIAMGVSGLVVSFAFSLAPKMLDLLITRFGYQGAWVLLGVLSIFVMGAIGWLLIRDNPEECGMRMDGLSEEQSKSAADKQKNPDMIIKREFNRAEALATGAFWVFSLSVSWYGLYSTAFTFHIVSLAAEFGRTKEFILTLFIPIALIGVVTNLVFGAVNPIVRLKLLLVIMNVAAVLASVGLLKIDQTWGAGAFVVGNGIVGGAFSNLTGVVFARFFGRMHLGAITGVNMAAMVIASGIGPLLFGMFQQWLGSYYEILLACVFVPAVFAVFSWILGDNPQRKL